MCECNKYLEVPHGRQHSMVNAALELGVPMSLLQKVGKKLTFTLYNAEHAPTQFYLLIYCSQLIVGHGNDLCYMSVLAFILGDNEIV